MRRAAGEAWDGRAREGAGWGGNQTGIGSIANLDYFVALVEALDGVEYWAAAAVVVVDDRAARFPLSPC